MKIHPFNAIYPNVSLIASADAFFSTARNDYLQYYESGFFRESKNQAFYIMEMRSDTETHTGLVVLLDVDDYTKGRIVKHEKTIPSHEQEMLKVLLQRGTMVKPVLVCHPIIREITREIQKLKKKTRPFLEMTTTDGPYHHALYEVDEKAGQNLVKLYKTLVPKVYIADGHHRCSTAEKLLKLQGKKRERIIPRS